MGSFVITKSGEGCHFVLKSSNGQIVATSQHYTAVASCKKGIESVRTNAAVAALEDQTKEGFETQKHPKFEIYTDKAGEFRFRLTAHNGENIISSQAYTQKESCKKGIESVRANAAEAPIEEVEA